MTRNGWIVVGILFMTICAATLRGCIRVGYRVFLAEHVRGTVQDMQR